MLKLKEKTKKVKNQIIILQQQSRLYIYIYQTALLISHKANTPY
jgi:hypothetical protein